MRSRQVRRDLLQIIFWTLLALSARCSGQTASTGALVSEAVDPSGTGIARASVDAKNQDTYVSRSTLSDDAGQLVLPLLPPRAYKVAAVKNGYSPAALDSVGIPMTESVRLSIPMKLAGLQQHIEARAAVSHLQSDSVALGRVVGSHVLEVLPLASRIFT